MKSIISVYLFLAVFSSVLVAQYPNVSSLKLDEIMKGKEFVGFWPEGHRYLPNDEVLFQWKTSDHEGWFKTSHKSSPVPMTEEEVEHLPIYGYQLFGEGHAVYVKGGVVYVWYKDQKSPEVLYEGASRVSDVFVTNEEHEFVLLIKDNLYKLSLRPGRLNKITDFYQGAKASKKDDSYLQDQQDALFEYIKRDEVSDVEKGTRIPEGDLNKFSVGPEGKRVCFQLTNRVVPKYTEMPVWIAEDGYVFMQKARPKVGREDAQNDYFFYDLQNDQLVKFNQEVLKDLNKEPSYWKDYDHGVYPTPGVVFHGGYFNPKGDKVLIEVKSFDNKNRWIVLYDFTTQKFKLMNHQHDDAWIGGPGISGWNGVPGNMGWINDEEFFFQSEVSGYSHLYTVNVDKLTSRQITKGEFEIIQADLSNDGKSFYVVANKNTSANRNFYQVDIKSGKMSELLNGTGNYQVLLNDDQNEIVYTHSKATSPWELYTAELKNPDKSLCHTSSRSQAFNEYSWHVPEIVNFKANDGKELTARLYRKGDVKNKPAVIFVHGAGYLQNAHNWWSVYYREYMFHNFLLDNGYVVLDVDYRGSEGYGSEWRTDVYRHLGGKDLADQIAGKEFLLSLGVDENKIGMYGGSYGGFMTIMALLQNPGEFACGAGLRSVTDWTHYNHEYTSNRLNTPLLDSLAFQKSSPIYFAENLEDPLLLLHGMVDDNVQYQDVVQLSQRFIELKKDNWDLVGYPVEPHGFRNAYSWYDEYKRIYLHFEKYLK